MKNIPVESPADPRVDELEHWMRIHLEEQLPELLRKSVAYGSDDLELIGRALAMLLPEERQDDVRPEVLGITFYLLGKVARVFSQLRSGSDPMDSFLDAEIYARMAQRYLAEGKWL